MAESTPLHLTEATIRELASAEVFRRGRSYFRSGHVKSLVRRGAAIEAAVKGSMPFPYQVVLQPGSGGGVIARCTCPYAEEGWGGWCKHAVAAAFAYLEQGDQLPLKPTLEETLAAAPADHLRRLLLEWGRGSPELSQRIELWLARIQAQEEAMHAAASLAATDTTGEIERFVQRLRAALARLPQPQPPAREEAWPDPDDEGSWYEYSEYDIDEYDEDDEGEWLMWPEGTLGADLITLFDEVMALAIQGRPAQSLAVLAAMIPILLNEPALADGLALATAYGADLAPWRDLWSTVDDVAAYALLVLEPEPATVDRWRALTKEWARSLQEMGLMFTFPRVHWLLELKRKARGRLLDAVVERAQAGALPPELRHTVLDAFSRRGEDAAYLAVARRYAPEQYGRKLITSNRVEELLDDPVLPSLAATQLLSLAETAAKSGALPAALQLGRKALQQRGFHRAGAARWLSQWAVEAGDHAFAVETAMLGLLEAPTLEEYRRVQALAGDQWPELRAELLTAMSERTNFLWRGQIIQIFLAEGMVDRALALLGREPSLRELEMVLPQAIEQQPAEMMRLCLRSAERQVRLAKAAAYEEAIGYLTHARAAAERAGLMDEWSAFVARLREEHARKRTFISLLNRLR